MKNSTLMRSISLMFFLSIAICSYSQNTSGSSDSAITMSCGVPTNLQIINLTPNKTFLKWNTVVGATNYVIRFRPVGTTAWRRLFSPNNVETLTGLLPNTQYEVKLRCDCGTVEGAYSALSYFTTYSNSTCAGTPSYFFTADNLTPGSCLIGWYSVQGAIRYNIQYRMRPDTSWMVDSSLTNSRVLIGLFSNSVYEFRIQSVCSSNSSAYSQIGMFTTPNGNCAAPDNLSAYNITDTTADLSWDTLACATQYILNYHVIGTTTWTTDTIATANYQLINLAMATGYEFKVSSINSSGYVSPGSQIYAFSTTPVAVCGIAANLSDSSVTSNEAFLRWDIVSGAVFYNIQYRISGTTTWHVDSTTVNNIFVTGLTANSTYDFRVRAVCAASSGSYSAIETFQTLPVVAITIPVPDHVVICIMENKAYSQIIGNSLTPNINSLVNGGNSTLFDESYGLTHPSQPNYLYLFSGSNQGVTNNNKPSSHFTTPNLARELLNAGYTFVQYSEGLPSVGYDGAVSGNYQRKHNPIANWTGSGANQVPTSLSQPFSNFPTNYNLLPTVSIITPDMNNSMHDGSTNTSLATGDNWILNNLFPYIQWAKTHNSLFILTFDEDDGAHVNHIATIFAGEMVANGVNSQPITHYNVLRTIEEMYDLNFIGGSANASVIRGCWTNGFKMANPDAGNEIVEGNWLLYPNPAKNEVNIKFDLSKPEIIEFNIYDETGKLLEVEKMGEIKEGSHNFKLVLTQDRFPDGTYFIEFNYGNNKRSQKFQIIR